jgi:hypothetical protein
MSQRFFRASAGVYESARNALDNAFGLPDPLTQTCISPVTLAPKDSDGRVYLAVASEWCEWEAVAPLLSGLLASGSAEEISEETYQSVWPTLP